MAVMRFDPFRDFDRLTEQFFGGTRGMRSIPMEAYRRGDQFFIHLDLPGVNPDDVDLTLERNVITIRAERRSPRQEGDEVLIDERPQGGLVLLAESPRSVDVAEQPQDLGQTAPRRCSRVVAVDEGV